MVHAAAVPLWWPLRIRIFQPGRLQAPAPGAGNISNDPPQQQEKTMTEPIKTSFAHGQLRAFVERIERLEEEKSTIAGDIKEIYAEAAGNGFDVKILRKLIALRKQDDNERQETESMLDVYMAALGMPVAAE
jgi:uncharacterized protein (UPF0335 family)